MRPTLLVSIALLVVVGMSGCSDRSTTIESEPFITLARPGAEEGRIVPETRRNFRAHLNGGQEVPPVSTRAQGQAIFHLSSDGTELHYKLIVANITNVLQAHIHMAPAGANGPVVTFLYPSGPPPVLIEGRFSGVLAEGTITASNLIGPLSGQPLSALMEVIQLVNAYVNVHTVQNPGGEVRGQIM